MTGRMRWCLIIVTGTLLGVVTAACTGTTPEPPAGTTPVATSSGVESSVHYVLRPHMCDAVDTTALRDLYPAEEPASRHLLNTQYTCGTAVIAGNKVVGLTVEGHTVPDSTYERTPTVTRDVFETQRRIAGMPPKDIDGAGSAAFWYGSDNRMWLETYDGNLNLTIEAFVVNDTHTLPPDMPQRLAALATATLARLVG